MAPAPPHLRVYVDANVFFSGVVATNGPFAASHVLLVTSNISPLELVCAEMSVLESRRNLEEKVPEAISDLEVIIEHGVTVVPDPSPEREREFFEYADRKDAIHLAAAVDNECGYLATYNLSDFSAEELEIEVVEPGVIVGSMRQVFTPGIFTDPSWVR
jgi:predicted nucleic acid-binding protein